jgi:hypothetical protein
MAVKTWTELREYVQANFIENYDEDITAEQLRVFLIDLLDTLSTILINGLADMRRGKINVTTAGTYIEFSRPFDDLDYEVIGMVISGHAKVSFYETDFTVDGFMVHPLQNGEYRYIAVPLS